MQAIQYLFVAFALVCWALATVVHVSGVRLARDLKRFRTGGAADRQGSNAYFYEYLNSRLTLTFPVAIVLAVVTTFFIGYGVVYYLAPNLVIPLLVAVVIYAIYLNLDSVEAVLFERHLAKAPPEKVGRWELNFGSWGMEAIRRGRRAFVALGVAMILLTPFATQLVQGAELGVSLYIGGVYLLADSITPQPGLGSVLVALIYVFSVLGALWALRRVAGILRSRRPSGFSGQKEGGPVS